MSLEVAAADFVLGTLAPHQLPAVCERALEEGRNSRSLYVLAGISTATYDRWEVEGLWANVLRELDIPVPSKSEAAEVVLIDAAARAVSGELPPERALARVIEGSYYGSGAYEREHKIAGDSLDLQSLVGLYYAYDEVDQEWSRSAEELDEEILAQFRGLLARRSPG